MARRSGACVAPGVSNDNRRMSDSILTLPCVEPRSLRTKVPAFKMLNLFTSVTPDIVSVLLFPEPHLDTVQLSDTVLMMGFVSLSWQVPEKIFK
jgi:hypothetical protein